ncbi:MAG: UDP-N-acetylmuramoyl-tripeptide--D-alanyl-D-alanine ligase [Candidatus Limnocylindrales bacterium]
MSRTGGYRLCDTDEVTDARLPEPRLGAGPLTLTATELAAATGGRLLHISERPIRGGAVDSRQVRAGNLFVALAGERTDGHRFLSDAVAAGAAALMVADSPALAPAIEAAVEAAAEAGGVSVVAVPDTLLGLHAAAAAWRGRFSPLVVGVTGSIAKTSTKEAIAAVLSERFVTLKSEGNANNEVGLPLTVLRMGPEHQAAVLEMGMYVGGEIAQLAAIARPAIGVVTAVLGVHLSRIGSIEAVERAKGELVEALPADGVAVLNADDPRVVRMRHRTSARPLTYGFAPGADVCASDVESAGLDGMRFTLVAPWGRALVSSPALGRHGVHNGLAAAAVALAAGLDMDLIATGLGRGWQAPHRDQIVHAGAVTILDDSYNASPASMIAALELLATLPGRHVAVLGEMLELGEAHDRGHREVGAAAAALAEMVVVVGDRATGIATGAASLGEAVLAVPDREAALAVLRDRLRPGDAVLVKASRAAELEWLVESLVGELGGRGAEEDDR